MTATQVIAEIKALPPNGRDEVLRFTRTMETAHALSADELEVLAEKLAATDDRAEAARLKEELTIGFYGTK
ncbi:MAG: hypothetical protein K8R87_11040 [Verrucomicrobia bacterium]|nr:hypothetical protein [Verrucomicrobiota bacterium]